MQQGNVLRVRTLSTVNFLDALTTGQAKFEALDVATLQTGGGGAGLSAGLHMRSRLRELRISSVQNLAWAVELWGSTATPTDPIDTHKFFGRWEFAAADGRQVDGSGLWRYWVPGLDLSYQDLLNAGKLYVLLVNLDVVSKIADADGAIVLEFAMEPTQGW